MMISNEFVYSFTLYYFEYTSKLLWAMTIMYSIVCVQLLLRSRIPLAQEIELSVYIAHWACVFSVYNLPSTILLRFAIQWTAFLSLWLTSLRWMGLATSTTCLLSSQFCRVWSLKPRQRLKWLTKPRKHANWYGQIIKVILSVFFRIYLYMCNMYITMKFI